MDLDLELERAEVARATRRTCATLRSSCGSLYFDSMWYLVAFGAGLVVAWAAWKSSQVGRSWRIATAGLDLGRNQRLVLRLMRIAWRSATKISDENCIPMHRLMAVYVWSTDDEVWADRMKQADWLPTAVQAFVDLVARSMDPSDPLIIEAQKMGLIPPGN